MQTRSLSQVSQEQLLQGFSSALLSLRTSEEALQFIVDLLTRKELTTLTKRLRIAALLLDGKDYRTIEEGLKVSHGTIARVAVWLADSGEGFRLVVERTKKQAKSDSSHRELSEWDKLKRRYPSMFWPQLILEEVVRNSNKQEKDRFRKAVEKIDHKSKFYKHFDQLLTSSSRKSRKFNAT